MFEESLYFSAFIIGLLGSTHCAGMCGGIISGLTLGISKTNRRKYFFSYSLIYNLGRIISYAAAGAITAGMGNIADNYDFGIEIRKGFTLLAAITMIFIGLYINGWSRNVILRIEKIGTFLWRWIEPFAKKLLPVNSKKQALIAGLIWGWLPCGLVYSSLFLAISANNMIKGIIIMTSFGIGTLPTLITFGYFSNSLINHLKKKWVRFFAGLMIIFFGILQLKIHLFS